MIQTFGSVSLDVPDGWSDRSIIVVAAPKGDGPVRATLSVSREKIRDRTFDQIVADMRKNIVVQRYPGLRFSKQEKITFQGQPAFEFVFTHSERMQCVQVVALAGPLAFSISLISDKESADEAMLRQMMQGLRFESVAR